MNNENIRLFAVDCARTAVNRYARGNQRELSHACLDVITARALYGEAWAAAAALAAAHAGAALALPVAALAAALAASTAAGPVGDDTRVEKNDLLLRYINGEQGPFVEAKP